MSNKHDEKLSLAAMAIHESWCRDNGYKPQASSSTSTPILRRKSQAPRYKGSDYAARRAASK